MAAFCKEIAAWYFPLGVCVCALSQTQFACSDLWIVVPLPYWMGLFSNTKSPWLKTCIFLNEVFQLASSPRMTATTITLFIQILMMMAVTNCLFVLQVQDDQGGQVLHTTMLISQFCSLSNTNSTLQIPAPCGEKWVCGQKKVARTFPTQGPKFVGKRRIRQWQGPFFSCEFIFCHFWVFVARLRTFQANLRQNPFLQNPTECWAHARTCSRSLALCSHSARTRSHSARTLLALCSHSARTRSHSLALARTLLALCSYYARAFLTAENLGDLRFCQTLAWG